MVGGTKLPPQDSESGPWSHEQKAKATPRATPKPKPSTKGKRKTFRLVRVSLDNADTVIDGVAHIFGREYNASRPSMLVAKNPEGAPGFALFETWDSTVVSILGFGLTEYCGVQPERRPGTKKQLDLSPTPALN
jgi:hypothetical protein